MDLKLVLTTKNRNTAMICHLFSRCRHSQNRRVENASSNQNAFVVLSKMLVKKYSYKTETTCQRQPFDHYSTCKGRSLRNPNLIAIE